MLKKLIRLGLIAATLALTACATPPASQDYTAFKESKPRSILVLPPLNESPDIAATYSVLSLVTMPLAESGYYVFPVGLMNETFKQNGVVNAGEIHNIPLDKLQNIFGADSALYITVSKYGSSYRIVDSVVEVAVYAKLVDLRTGTVLFQKTAFASTAENNNNNSAGLIGMLVTALVNQIVNNVSDTGFVIADRATQRLLTAGSPNAILYGPYSPKYQTD